MKKLFFLFLFVIISVTASAQFAGSGHVVGLKGSKVYVDGVRISNDQVLAGFKDVQGQDLSSQWQKSSNGYKTGVGLTVAGGSLAAGGSLTLCCGLIVGAGTAISLPVLGMPGLVTGDFGVAEDFADQGFSTAEKLITIGGTCALVGIVMTAAGIPTMCIYKNKMKGMLREASPSMADQVTLSAGPTANGVGLALRF